MIVRQQGSSREAWTKCLFVMTLDNNYKSRNLNKIVVVRSIVQRSLKYSCVGQLLIG